MIKFKIQMEGGMGCEPGFSLVDPSSIAAKKKFRDFLLRENGPAVNRS